MKKTNILMLPLLFSCALFAVGEEKKNDKQKIYRQTIITPVLEHKMEPGKNIIWCVTYQLAWNELCKLTGGPFKTSQTIPMVESLNKHTSTEITLNENCYVAIAGSYGSKTFEKINQAMQKKFHGRASPVFLNKPPEGESDAWLTYAYMEKRLPFKFIFSRYYNNLKFGNRWVQSFGRMYQEGRLDALKQVAVHDYIDKDNFIIELKTKIKHDKLILAKISPKQTLEETILSVCKRLKDKTSEAPPFSQVNIPIIDFDLIQKYHELYKEDFFLAEQRIRFRLDEKGAILVSEAIAAFGGGGIGNCIFDKPFLVMIFRNDPKGTLEKTNLPYFALWIENTELLLVSKSK